MYAINRIRYKKYPNFYSRIKKKHPNFKKSGVQRLTCAECNGCYVQQAGRNFITR